MLRPMIPLTCGVAILDDHTRLTCLETSAPSNAALGATAIICHDGDDSILFLPTWTNYA